MLHGRLMSNGNTWRSVLGAKSPTLPRKGGRMRGGGGGGAAGMVCIVEVAARRWLAGCSEQECGWLGASSWCWELAGPDARGGHTYGINFRACY